MQRVSIILQFYQISLPQVVHVSCKDAMIHEVGICRLQLGVICCYKIVLGLVKLNPSSDFFSSSHLMLSAN